MICLDTNYLIRSLVVGSQEADEMVEWIADGETLAAPAVAWYEFVSGPVGDEEVAVLFALLRGGVLPFAEAEAFEAARLFNAAGRPRRLRVDAMIAASCTVARAPLATGNRSDFEPFVAHGLVLCQPRRVRE